MSGCYKNRLGFSLIFLWFIATCYAFWWFEYRHWQAFSDQTVLFESSTLDDLYHNLSPEPGKVVVVHFAQSNCPCHRYQIAHIDNLKDSLSDVQQLQIAVNSPVAKHLSIPASPSVAIWNQYGEMAYFGPYSSGAFCGRGTDFVTRVINEIRADRNPQWLNSLAIGCYCDWPTAKA